ncbi:MAG: DegT/DnrJ/EryC1/StrS aminotransferase family protein, partial [Bacteroidetes bacterium]|nr:DegT/DnrJ/EryC1/StrS aminotransferase family protein [Bacteroidota bacterium]
RSWEFDVTSQGWRYHMSNIMAAIGKVQFERFPGLASKRQQLAFYYDEMLSKLEQVTCLQRDYHVVVPHIYVIKIKGLKNRKALQESLESKGIQTGIHYQPNHQLSFYNDTNILPLPITDAVYPTLLTLPLHPDLSIEDVEYVCTELKKYLDDAQ